MKVGEFKQLENAAILVTGGAGFIGSNLTKELLKNKARVICFDDLSTGKKDNIDDFLNNKNFKFIQGDVNVYSHLEKVFNQNKIDYVFHYAATVGVIRTIEKPLKVMEDIDGIKNILHLSNKNKVKKIIFSSSSEVYGEPVALPEKEDGPLNPKFPYAIVKLLGESYFKIYNDNFNLKTCALRFFNVYGPKQESSSYGFVMGVFIRQILKGEPITVFGDGLQTRDFVFVEDNIKAQLLALLNPKTNGEVINIGNSKPITILNLAETLIKISNKKNIKIKLMPFRNGGEIMHRFPDIKKMKDFLNYKPTHSLEDGIKKTLTWYESKLK